MNSSGLQLASAQGPNIAMGGGGVARDFYELKSKRHQNLSIPMPSFLLNPQRAVG